MSQQLRRGSEGSETSRGGVPRDLRIGRARSRQGQTWGALTFDQKVSHPALIVMATLAMGLLLVYLSFILVPLVMSIFFSYFLQPIVDLLTERPLTCCGRDCAPGVSIFDAIHFD